MGFSVSGATAIIFLGLFIAFGSAFTIAANSYDAVANAETERADRLLAQQNTAINITDIDTGTNTITVENTGTEELTVSGTTVIVDGQSVTTTTTSVDGDRATDLWLPGEPAQFEVAVTPTQSVKIVTEYKVADRMEVT